MSEYLTQTEIRERNKDPVACEFSKATLRKYGYFKQPTKQQVKDRLLQDFEHQDTIAILDVMREMNMIKEDEG